MDEELEQVLQQLTGSRIALAEEGRIERRRYALLSAASRIYAAGQHEVRPLPDDPSGNYFSNWQNYESAVTEAGELLGEIEKREKAEAGS